MAGLLNTVYLVAATIVAVAGLLFVVGATRDSDAGGSSLLDWSLIVVGVVFLVGMAAGFVN